MQMVQMESQLIIFSWLPRGRDSPILHGLGELILIVVFVVGADNETMGLSPCQQTTAVSHRIVLGMHVR